MLLMKKRSKAAQRTVTGVLLFAFLFVLAGFPGLYAFGLPSPRTTPDEIIRLSSIGQSASCQKALFQSDPQKGDEQFSFLSATIKAKKIGSKKFVLGKKKFEGKNSVFLTFKSSSLRDNFWLEFTLQRLLFSHLTHLNPWLEPRAPPYSL